MGLVWGISPGHSTVVLWRYGVITSEVSEKGALSGQHYLKGLSDTSVFYITNPPEYIPNVNALGNWGGIM